MPLPLTRVAVIGVNSRIGPAILHALCSAQLEVTVLLRPSSQPVAPMSPAYKVKQQTVPSDPPSPEELAVALSGQDALVCALHPSTPVLQRQLVDACVATGVRRCVLADYGSVESEDPVAVEAVPLFANKTAVRDHARLRSQQSGGAFSWTALVTGHFFDYGLASSLLGFDLANRSVRLFDTGSARWSTSTTAFIAEAVVRILNREHETRNRVLYVQSFCVTQRQVLQAVEKSPYGETLRRVETCSEDYIEEMKRKAAAGSYEAMEQIVCVLGLTRANWQSRPDFANELLGLQEEKLQTVVDSVCEKVFKGKGS